jgi:hypothetical protein
VARERQQVESVELHTGEQAGRRARRAASWCCRIGNAAATLEARSVMMTGNNRSNLRGPSSIPIRRESIKFWDATAGMCRLLRGADQRRLLVTTIGSGNQIGDLLTAVEIGASPRRADALSYLVDRPSWVALSLTKRAYIATGWSSIDRSE